MSCCKVVNHGAKMADDLFSELLPTPKQSGQQSNGSFAGDSVLPASIDTASSDGLLSGTMDKPVFTQGDPFMSGGKPMVRKPVSCCVERCSYAVLMAE